MKKILIVIMICILMVVCAFTPRKYKQPIIGQLTNENSIRIMSYNVKNSYQDNEGWYERREALINLILKVRPDSLGIQEADENWMRYLEENLDDYIIVGEGRNGGDSGEHTAILYLEEKYELTDSGTFWLSNETDKPSTGWDGACPRVCTYAKLKNLETGKIFVHYNTHLDHVGKEARINGARLIIDKIRSEEIPTVLTGDFNVLEKSKVYDIILKSNMEDSKFIAEKSMSFGTMNYFTNFHFRYVPPIDFIFLSKDDFEVNNYQVLYQYKHNNKPVSDHFPIYSDIIIK